LSARRLPRKKRRSITCKSIANPRKLDKLLKSVKTVQRITKIRTNSSNPRLSKTIRSRASVVAVVNRNKKKRNKRGLTELSVVDKQIRSASSSKSTMILIIIGRPPRHSVVAVIIKVKEEVNREAVSIKDVAFEATVVEEVATATISFVKQ